MVEKQQKVKSHRPVGQSHQDNKQVGVVVLAATAI